MPTKSPPICARGYISAIKSDPTMSIDKLIDYSSKVCEGKIADHENKKYKKSDSLITINSFHSNETAPYIRSQSNDLIDLCTGAPCITGKSKRCIRRKDARSLIKDREELCLGMRQEPLTFKNLKERLRDSALYIVVCEGLTVGIIDKMGNFNISVPEKHTETAYLKSIFL